MKTVLPFLLCTIVFVGGCNKQANQLDQSWTSPTQIAESIEGLGGRVSLYKLTNSIIALQSQPGNTAKCLVMNHDRNGSNSWAEMSLEGIPRGYFWAYPTIDQTSDRVFFQQGYTENDQLVVNMLVGRMVISGSIAVRDVMEKKWITDKKSLFGETRPNVRLGEPGRRDSTGIQVGLMINSDLYIPYCIRGETYYGNGVAGDEGPFNNGVFHSPDSGATWQIEKISDFQGYGSSICKTKGYHYYLVTRLVRGGGYQLWFARKPIKGSPWDTPTVLTKTFANAFGHFVAKTENETVHVCWMDRRHEKKRFNLTYPDRQNWEIAYSQRKDSDSDWSKGIILSKGLLYSYFPSMSVEGNKVVVAWSGVRTAPDWHSFNDPNDIYYVTSKDGGKTWDKPLKVTDGAKDGITSGMPQVVLQNGVIHLSFIQGKMNLKQESPGLTKLNQPPWPIYYQQRPFPN